MEKYTNKHAVSIAIDFLQYSFTGNRFKNRILEFAKSIPFDIEALLTEKADLFDLIDEMEISARSALADMEEDIRYYFAPPDTDGKCESLYSFVLLQQMTDTYNLHNPAELSVQLEQMSKEDFCKAFGEILCSYDSNIKNDMEVPVFDSPISVVSYILNMDLSAEVKWKLQDIYLNRDEHRGKFLHVLQKTIDFIKEYEKPLDEQAANFYSYWNARRGDRDYYSFLTDEFPVFSGFSPCKPGYRLYPCIFFPMISLSIPTDHVNGEPTAPAGITLGMIYGDALSPKTVLEASFSDTSRRKCMDALKLLSDKSRFAILKYISEKEENEAYGSEIAKHLGLTTATVSHHMSTLHEAGLVAVQKRKTKLFYSVNKETLKKYLEYCEQQLL